MRHEEFKIGMEFTAAGSLSGRWRCTDVGTRAIVAIQIEPGNDPSWCDGPPYAVAELVFDEDDIVACNKCEEIIGANGASTEEDKSERPGRCFAAFASRSPAARMAGSPGVERREVGDTAVVGGTIVDLTSCLTLWLQGAGGATTHA